MNLFKNIIKIPVAELFSKMALQLLLKDKFPLKNNIPPPPPNVA